MEMGQSEPVLVPQWYKLANGSASNNGRSNLRNCSSEHSDENGLGIKTKNGSFSHRSRNLSPLRRSFSSNSSASKSQAYSSFRRSSSRDRNKEKGFDSRDRENRSNVEDNGFFDHYDLYIRTRFEKEALRRSQSLRTERQGDTWPRKIDDGSRSRVSPSGAVSGGIRKTSFDKEFPSLVADGRKAFPDAIGTQSVGLRTAVESLSISAPVIIGSSALAEIPAHFAGNGSGPSSATQVNHISSASGSTTSLNMAEALVRTPPNVRAAPQVSTDSQRIEELTFKKCKQLIPVTTLMPKVSICNSLEKTKYKVATNGEFVGKFGQHTPHTSTRLHAASDNPKASQAGNLQVLNRERHVISPTSNDSPNQNLVKSVKPMVLAPSGTMLPVKKQTYDSMLGPLSQSQSLSGEKRLLSQAKNRSDFFNLLRKKSMENANGTPGSGSFPSSESEKLEGHNAGTISDSGHTQEDVSNECLLESYVENGDHLHVNTALLQPEGLLSDIQDSSDPYSDPVLDPEEEAFLESLGWDKNAWVDALTKEEIDGFLEKYEKQRQFKTEPGLHFQSKFN